MHTILLGSSANKAQHPPVMLHRRAILRQADKVVVALLLSALHLVLQAVEACPWAHAGGAACLALPFLHPV